MIVGLYYHVVHIFLKISYFSEKNQVFNFLLAFIGHLRVFPARVTPGYGI